MGSICRVRSSRKGPGYFYAENGAQAIKQARERARADRDDDAMMILDIIDKNLVCGSPQIVEGLRLRGVRDGRRGGLLVIDR